MELKGNSSALLIPALDPVNRTLMELKVDVPNKSGHDLSVNRTLMELKDDSLNTVFGYTHC